MWQLGIPNWETQTAASSSDDILIRYFSFAVVYFAIACDNWKLSVTFLAALVLIRRFQMS